VADLLGFPSGHFDRPQPCTAPGQDNVDAVAALNMLRDRIPHLIRELHRVHQEVPAILVEVLTADASDQRWLALAALCEEPAEIMRQLGHLCREQGKGSK
jgi:hypothetical protein